MGLLQTYSNLLVKYPGSVLTACSISVLLLFLLTTILRPLQSFNDPFVGFEARNTDISNKINTWRLLVDENSANADNISLLPNSNHYDYNYQYLGSNRQYSVTNNGDNYTDVEPEPPVVEMSTQQIGKTNNLNDSTMLDEFEDEYFQMVNSSMASSPSLIHYSLDSSKAFCGKLYEGYAQVVVSPSTSNIRNGLYNLNSLLAICQLDRQLRLEQSADDHAVFHKDCEQFVEGKSETDQIETTACCNSWSLPNHIACLSNKTNCMQLDAQDLKMFEQMIKFCAPFYYKAPFDECFTPTSSNKDELIQSTTTMVPSAMNLLNPSTHNLEKLYCGNIPEKCLKCGGWTYNVLHYLTNENFIKNKPPMARPLKVSTSSKPRISKSAKLSSSKDLVINKLTYTNIFLPMAKSSSLMRYYRTLSRYHLKTQFAQVKVLSLGLKNSLFEHLVSHDSKLFVVALISILFIISIYTWSFLLSSTILIVICLSLCLSYTIYELMLNIAIFPFMNLLAIVIFFGICSDNAMLFCKHWELDQGNSEAKDQIESSPTKSTKYNIQPVAENQQSPEARDVNVATRLDRMLKRAVISTSAATFATACSFLISALSQVVAVRCFCIFSTLTVITNYLLTIILLPPALILDLRFRQSARDRLKQSPDKHIGKLLRNVELFRKSFSNIGEIVHQRWILRIVINYKPYLIITFITLIMCASILVFRTGLLPSDEDDIQLLSKKHEFEQYDRNLKRQFAFERAKQGKVIGANVRPFHEAPDTLPLRIVFGVIPTDNGNHLDPDDRGHLIFDEKFDLADEHTQIWLLEFCHKLKRERFIHATTNLEMSTCFIEGFKTWMEARPCQDPMMPGRDRSPCCQAFDFPYTQLIFDRCIGDAISSMRQAPHMYMNTNAGVRFHKNSTKVAALIIEMPTNRPQTQSFNKMEKFYHDVNEWVNWNINNTAPPGLRSGWFVSNNMELLALQGELDSSTNVSVLLEIIFAMLALSISTQNLVITLAGTLTIGAIIVIVIAILVLLRWTLGVAESILISLTIGLSIDFALHYSVAYSEGSQSRASVGVIERILGEVGSPIALATVTTSISGLVIFQSDILAYKELGIFLLLIATVSWLSSTFFLLPMLATIDAIRDYSERYFTSLLANRLLKWINRH